LRYKAPRGTQDILPSTQDLWKFVREKAQSLCHLYGYQRIDTPVFEETGLFRRSIGTGTDIVEKEMYTFADHGGDQMTLRPEGTAPVCRAYIEHGLHNQSQPVRLYYLTSIFRYERPQAGRYRQHHQFGCEAIGDADPALDAEVIDVAWQFYASLGLKDLTLQLNSIGCQDCRPQYVETLKNYYLGHRETLCQDCKTRLGRNPLRLLDCKNSSCQELAEAAPKAMAHLCLPCAKHLQEVKGYLEDLNIPFELDTRLVRGLDYYTRTVFEIQPRGGGAQSTIGGGGRYDLLIEELGGRPTPAVGFATGLERVLLNLQKQGVAVPPIPQPGLYVSYSGEVEKEEAIKLAAALRQAGLGAVLSTGRGSMRAQLKHANALKATWAVIVGEDELKRGKVVLRDMTRGEQEEIAREEIIARLKASLD